MGSLTFQFLGGDLKRVDMNASETGSSETVYFEPARFFGRFGFGVSTISANISPSAHSAVHKDIFVINNASRYPIATLSPPCSRWSSHIVPSANASQPKL